MPSIKLTPRAIDRLRAPDPSGEQVLFWDTDLRGFGVRVSGKTNDKAYVVQRAIDGRSRRVTIGNCNVLTLPVARQRAEVEIGQSFSLGIDPKQRRRQQAAAGGTLRQVMEEYLSRQDLRPRSRDSYRAAIEAHLNGWLDRPLGRIDRAMIEARHADIAEEIESRHLAKAKLHAERWEARAKAAEARGWLDAAANHRARAKAALSRKPASGFATANGAMRALRALWNYAADRHPEIGTNPVKLRRQWHPVAPRERHLQESDMAAFYRAAMALESPVGRDYILLLLYCGLRRREAASLKWADVDLSARVIRIPAAKTKAKRKLDLPMSDFVHDLMVARRAIGRDRNDYVFPANSKSGHIEEPRFFLDRIAKSRGVRISAHDLRRSFVTVAESTNISPIALRALVNHSLGKDVTSGYVQMTPERLREPAQLVCNKLKLLCGIVGPEGRNVAKLKR